VRRLALLALLVLAGCGGEDESAAPDPAALRGEAWVLSGGIDVPGWEAVAPSATFADGRVSGSSGCNRFDASYTLDGARLRLGELRATRMACPGTGDEVERAFTAALGQVAAWRVDDELVLLDADDAELLRFTPASAAGDWVVTAFRQPDSVSSPLPGTKLTATFADGKLSGNAGCNPYTTTYRAERGTVEIAPLAAGEMLCDTPEGIMDQERTYLEALPAAASYELAGSNLTLLAADGTIVATFERAG
jgi:heat shock protein HslJ